MNYIVTIENMSTGAQDRIEIFEANDSVALYQIEQRVLQFLASEWNVESIVRG